MLVFGFPILDLTYVPLENHLVPSFLAHLTLGNVTTSLRMKTIFHDIEGPREVSLSGLL